MKISPIQKSITICVATSLMTVSCVSNKVETPAVETGSQSQTQTQPVVVKEQKSPQELDYEKYVEKTNGISVKIKSNPTETIKNKPFSSPYTIFVESSSGAPVPDFEIEALYPKSKNGEKIIYTTEKILTNAQGSASFMPPAPTESFNSSVSFYPAGDMSNKKIKQLSNKYTVVVPFKVKTDLKNGGGLISLVDYGKNGKPNLGGSTSSSNLLRSLLNLGFTGVGNADFGNAILKEDTNAVYEEAKKLIGTKVAFTIFGTVKYDALEKLDNGYKCTFTGDITCISMKTGKVLCHVTRTVSAQAKSEWDSLASARSKLSDEIAAVLNYGI